MLELAGIRVDARSIGGLETAIDLPDWKVCFDVGRSPRELLRRETILFTHAHMDHLGGIAYHCATRALMGMGPPTYVVPPSAVAPLQQLFAAWRLLDRSELAHHLLPLAPGERYEHRKDVHLEAFEVPHTVPAQGYVLWKRTTRLDERFRDLPQPELVRLAREGTQLDRTDETPEVAFCGDTRIQGLDGHPAVRRARLLILECTFLDERANAEEAGKRGHVHLDQIVERADWFENEAILLTHFSARYSRDQIERLLDERLPASLRARTTALLSD
ncbi:ribonuclease Z [Planctomycetes bacterium Pla163]|uniref:Ribonuclease Z n=1 Tax=Rohdeia mirabilis TaxID=2528008 RepID=A0A518CWJ5_9BACT|nr:ribonuclease Z [Planctomycetes bacterium Pla163]